MRFILLRFLAACCLSYFYLSASMGGALQSDFWVSLDVSDPLQKTVQAFLEKNAGKKLGMVIGRGNVQGIAESRITIDSLKGLEWLFVDPADTCGSRFFGNWQDESQGNALKTQWPVNFSLAGLFDAVVIDYGTLEYIGDNGRENELRRECFEKMTALKVVLLNGMVVSKEWFDSEQSFYRWLMANKSPEVEKMAEKYISKIELAKYQHRGRLIKGLNDAKKALKAGGMLIIPAGGVIQDRHLKGILCWNGVRSLKRFSPPNSDALPESPVLPENAPGMGAYYGDYYEIILYKKRRKI
jgi:hypothetical protein